MPYKSLIKDKGNITFDGIPLNNDHIAKLLKALTYAGVSTPAMFASIAHDILSRNTE